MAGVVAKMRCRCGLEMTAVGRLMVCAHCDYPCDKARTNSPCTYCTAQNAGAVA